MLNGKVCIVTGAAQGIGRSIVKLFVKNRAQMVFACDRNLEGVRTLEQQYDTVKAIGIDVADRKAIQDFIASTAHDQGRIDVLVNNAGVTRDALIDRMTEEDWDLVIAVNLKGVFNFTQAVAPVMIGNGSGSIVTISSIVGTDGNIGQTNYAASKGGVISMTKSWAKEFSRKGTQVRANCVAPGFVETPMTANLPEKVLESMKGKTPLGRMGKPEEIAEGVMFLASDRASFITGQVLKIDGGLVI